MIPQLQSSGDLDSAKNIIRQGFEHYEGKRVNKEDEDVLKELEKLRHEYAVLKKGVNLMH